MSIPALFRPKKFADVVGQSTISTALINIAKADGVAVRSILLQGSWGSGKSTLARIFGKAVNCSRLKELGDVCNECEGCKSAELRNSQTYIEYDSSRVGSVDAIRGLENVFASATSGRRVIVFDEIHAASVSAQTALLKVIEEGVKNTFIVFCTTNKVLDTIRSRSVCFEVTTLPVAMIAERVTSVAKDLNIEITAPEIEVLSLKSKGHMRDALSILEHYKLAGPVALKSPLRLLKKLTFLSIKSQPFEEVLNEILLFPINDTRTAISQMTRDFFVSTEGFDAEVRKQGLHYKVFNFFYTPVSQEAMKDEYGIEILLRAYYERLHS